MAGDCFSRGLACNTMHTCNQRGCQRKALGMDPVDHRNQPKAMEVQPALAWPRARDVGRRDDMSPDGFLRVGLDADNDVYVSVASEGKMACVEFCNGVGGAGRSMRTRLALIALMVAIEADNAERPDLDFWRT